MASIQRDLTQATTSQPKEEERDQDTLFCLSLVQEFKDLTAKNKRLTRVRIMQVFCDLHEDDNE